MGYHCRAEAGAGARRCVACRFILVATFGYRRHLIPPKALADFRGTTGCTFPIFIVSNTHFTMARHDSDLAIICAERLCLASPAECGTCVHGGRCLNAQVHLLFFFSLPLSCCHLHTQSYTNSRTYPGICSILSISPNPWPLVHGGGRLGWALGQPLCWPTWRWQCTRRRDDAGPILIEKKVMPVMTVFYSEVSESYSTSTLITTSCCVRYYGRGNKLYMKSSSFSAPPSWPTASCNKHT